VSKRGAIRASDADREQVVDRLHKASTEGRIASDELEHRVSTALKARTYGELEATVADLPGPRSRTAPTQRRTVPTWALSALRSNPMLLLFVIPGLAVTAAMLLAATVVWSVMMLVIFILGGGRGGLHPRPPWLHTGHHGLRAPRRGAGRYWA
jgi:Domain of unknown function (DUF1707)